ncbi:MAG: IS200/IS605 family transposase [Erysipelotrichaceae bacterium]
MKQIFKYKSSSNIVYNCNYHVIWCPKYRRKVLIDGVDKRLLSIIEGVANETNTEILEIEIMPDHVHILMSVNPQYGVNKVVKQMKGRSSNLLRKEYPWLKSRIPTLWTNSYFCCTVGGATLDVVKKYIEDQKLV